MSLTPTQDLPTIDGKVALVTGAARAITGQTLHVDGGYLVG